MNPFYEFHGGRLFSVVDRRYEVPEDKPYELAPLPEGQNMIPNRVSNEETPELTKNDTTEEPKTIACIVLWVRCNLSKDAPLPL
ncbi:hypothetical protein RJT34_09140 [Clitoria ternatea]|uniref:Uncharacterized protein n=1 Tax=Clitoria ternatea TaxID=43366 RepID=A0AAN9K5C0_CLITE